MATKDQDGIVTYGTQYIYNNPGSVADYPLGTTIFRSKKDLADYVRGTYPEMFDRPDQDDPSKKEYYDEDIVRIFMRDYPAHHFKPDPSDPDGEKRVPVRLKIVSGTEDIDFDEAFEDPYDRWSDVAGEELHGLKEMVSSPWQTGKALLHMGEQGVGQLGAAALVKMGMDERLAEKLMAPGSITQYAREYGPMAYFSKRGAYDPDATDEEKAAAAKEAVDKRIHDYTGTADPGTLYRSPDVDITGSAARIYRDEKTRDEMAAAGRRDEIPLYVKEHRFDPEVERMGRDLLRNLSAAGFQENPFRFVADWQAAFTPLRAAIKKGVAYGSKRAGRSLVPAPGTRAHKALRVADRAFDLADPLAQVAVPIKLGGKLVAKGAKKSAEKVAESKVGQYFKTIGSNLTNKDTPLTNEIKGSFLGFTTSLGVRYMQDLYRRAGTKLRTKKSFNEVFREAKVRPTDDILVETFFRMSSGADRIRKKAQDQYVKATNKIFEGDKKVPIMAENLFDNILSEVREYNASVVRVGEDGKQFRVKEPDFYTSRTRLGDDVPPLETTVDDIWERVGAELERVDIEGRERFKKQQRKKKKRLNRELLLEEVRRIATGKPLRDKQIGNAVIRMIETDLGEFAEGQVPKSSIARAAMDILTNTGEQKTIRRHGAGKGLRSVKPRDEDPYITEIIGEDPHSVKREKAIHELVGEITEQKDISARKTYLKGRKDIAQGEGVGIEYGLSSFSDLGANQKILSIWVNKFLKLQELRDAPATQGIPGLEAALKADEYQGIMIDAKRLHELRQQLDDDISMLTGDGASKRTKNALIGIRETVAASLENGLGSGYKNAMVEYEKYVKAMGEFKQLYGVEPGKISKNNIITPDSMEKVISRLSRTWDTDAFADHRRVILEKFQDMAEDDYIIPNMMGLAAREWYGSGLIVRSEMSQIFRGLSALQLTSLSALPALIMFSPRAMTEIILANSDYNIGGRAAHEAATEVAKDISAKFEALNKRTGGQLRNEIVKGNFKVGDYFSRKEVEGENERDREQLRELGRGPQRDLLERLSNLYSSMDQSEWMGSPVGTRTDAMERHLREAGEETWRKSRHQPGHINPLTSAFFPGGGGRGSDYHSRLRQEGLID
jgi:hypothetical protein